jgi:hypothetical protein
MVPIADLCQKIRDNDRLTRAGHSEQDAVLRKCFRATLGSRDASRISKETRKPPIRRESGLHYFGVHTLGGPHLPPMASTSEPVAVAKSSPISMRVMVTSQASPSSAFGLRRVYVVLCHRNLAVFLNLETIDYHAATFLSNRSDPSVSVALARPSAGIVEALPHPIQAGSSIFQRQKPLSARRIIFTLSGTANSSKALRRDDPSGTATNTPSERSDGDDLDLRCVARTDNASPQRSVLFKRGSLGTKS